MGCERMDEYKDETTCRYFFKKIGPVGREGTGIVLGIKGFRGPFTSPRRE
jgi:hypothetical protein